MWLLGKLRKLGKISASDQVSPKRQLTFDVNSIFFHSLVVDFDNEDEYDPEQFAGNQVPILIVGTKSVSHSDSVVCGKIFLWDKKHRVDSFVLFRTNQEHQEQTILAMVLIWLKKLVLTASRWWVVQEMYIISTQILWWPTICYFALYHGRIVLKYKSSPVDQKIYKSSTNL